MIIDKEVEAALRNRSDKPEPSCDPFGHEWEEGYYGNRCIRCGVFVAYGQEPWLKDEI